MKIVMVIFFRKNEVRMEKPIYLGFAILELSKLQMYGT